jgi:teichuronic acid biosynthesis glycosyltransferase TuaC
VVELRRCLAERPVDVVHAHYSYVGAVARTQWRVPVVVTFHGDDLLGSPSIDGRITPVSRVIAAAGVVLGHCVDGVIVQNEEMARRLRRDDVDVIPHEVDLECFRPTDREEARRELGLDAQRPYVLFAANPSWPRKNFPVADAAVGILRRSDPDVDLVVVHREPQPRLALYMSACDVLAFPTWQEGSPNVIKQAMACNMPIVATDAGDIPEIIGSTEGCHVVEPVPDAFAAAIGQELRRRRRTDGRQAVADLTPDRVAARVAAVYDRTLRRHGAARFAGCRP